MSPQNRPSGILGGFLGPLSRGACRVFSRYIRIPDLSAHTKKARVVTREFRSKGCKGCGFRGLGFRVEWFRGYLQIFGPNVGTICILGSLYRVRSAMGFVDALPAVAATTTRTTAQTAQSSGY